MDKIDRIIEIIRTLREEGEGGGSSLGPTNSLAAGKIAGTEFSGDHPPVRKKKKKKSKNYMSGGRGSRKMWLDFLRNK
jgi:hypothetical protein